MKGEITGKDYRSPKHKLIRFFEKSRNNWKKRCEEAKDRLRYYRNRTQFLEKSKEKFKKRANELEERVKQLEVELAFQKAAMEELKKKRCCAEKSRHTRAVSTSSAVSHLQC